MTTGRFETDFNEALRLRHAGEWRDSVEMFERLLEETRGDRRLRYLLLIELGGLYLFDLREYARSVESLGLAIQIRPKSHVCSIWRFYALVLSGRVADGLDELRRYLSLVPEPQLTSEHSRVLREMAASLAETLARSKGCGQSGVSDDPLPSTERSDAGREFAAILEEASRLERAGDCRGAADRLERLIEPAAGDRILVLCLLTELGRLYLYELSDDGHTPAYVQFVREAELLFRSAVEEDPVSEMRSMSLFYALVCSGKELEALDELARYMGVAITTPASNRALQEIADVMVHGVERGSK